MLRAVRHTQLPAGIAIHRIRKRRFDTGMATHGRFTDSQCLTRPPSQDHVRGQTPLPSWRAPILVRSGRILLLAPQGREKQAQRDPGLRGLREVRPPSNVRAEVPSGPGTDSAGSVGVWFLVPLPE